VECTNAQALATTSSPAHGLTFSRLQEFLFALTGKTKYSICKLKGSEHFGKQGHHNTP